MPNEKKVKFPANVVLAVNGSGLMDEDLMCDYLEKVIKPYVSDASTLHVMDSFRAHTTPKCKGKMNELELDWLIIPPGTTSLLQPCDVSINKPLKAKLREHWEDWFADEDYMFEIYTPCGNRKKPSYQCLVDWVSKSMMTLEQSMVQKSFVTCGIVRAKDFELDHLNTRLRQLLIDKNDWDEQEKVLQAINEEDNE